MNIVKNICHKDQGQSLVEFGLTFGIFVAFLYGLLGAGLWGASSFLVQEAAHAAARCYAGTGDAGKASEEADIFMTHWAYPLIKDHFVSISEEQGTCHIIITAFPRESIQQLFIFQEDSICRESKATMDYAIRYRYQFNGD